MVSPSMRRGAALVAFSVFLTLILGFGLPAVLNFAAVRCGFPEASVAECIVAVYLVFVLYVAMPSVPRGSVKVRCTCPRLRLIPSFIFDIVDCFLPVSFLKLS